MAKMKRSDFNYEEVQYLMDNPSLINSKSINWILEKFMPLGIYFMDYLQAPMIKMLKLPGPGRSLLSMFGMGKADDDVVRLKEQFIPLHDGTVAPTDVFLPKKVFKLKAKAPTILVRLPYWKDMMCILGYIFASMGYVCVLQDMRGCASANQYSTFALTYYLKADGMDALRWITKQFWYDGKIGTWGLSFLGITQLAVGWNNEGLITCMNPAQCSFTSVLYHPRGLKLLAMATSVYRLILGITQNKDPALTGMFNDPDGFINTIALNPLASLYNEPLVLNRYKLHMSDLAEIKDPEILTKKLNDTFNLNLKFEEKDKDGSLKKFMMEAFIKNRINTNYEYLPYAFGFDGSNLETPMYCVSSHYDMFHEQIMRDIKLIQKNSPEYFKTKFKMIIGPGAHGGLDLIPTGISIPPKPFPIPIKKLVALFQNFMPFWYYEHYLKMKFRDIERIPTIRCYILNTGKWRNLSQWPPKGIQELKLYLNSEGKANSRFGDGKLTFETPKEKGIIPDEYDFDPSNPVVSKGGKFLMYKAGPINQMNLEKRKDILIYTSDKLKEDIEVIGEPRIVLYASSTAKDTDFMVKLVDIQNGRNAFNIIDDGIRTRYRDGLENPSFIEPSKIYRYEFPIGNTAINFTKGHKIRIQITSSNFPKFDINSNLAGEKRAKGYQHAMQTIYHDADHPSCLILPVFKLKK
ncbi:MAG: CocE/NonD family hydrolase [Candidatus Lokiarchaeota archaeon]|nr:CocE/NonD family hydrolase [Candidatus Lokiarchaeota archaeon]